MQFERLYLEPSRNGIYKSKEYHGAGAKVVNMGELFRHEFIGAQEMARLDMTDQELVRSGLCDNDLLFGRRSLVESGAGKCSIVRGIVEPTTFESSLIRVRPDPHKVFPTFLYYWFRSPVGRGRIQAIVSGTNVKGIRGSDLRNVLIALPNMETQVKVAAILSAYDDLIENNRRRIALLEEAARQLYKEWFVRFRFPGHEHVKIIDGVPESWERTPASNVLNVLSGGTPKTTTAQFWGGDIGFFTPKDAVQGCYVAATEKMITEEGLARCNSKLYPKDTLFITARGTVGNMNLAMVPMAMNQSCYALKSKCGMSQRLLYLTMDASLQQLRSQASGAVFDAIIVATFDRIFVTKPEKHIADEFDDTVNPVFDQIANLERQIDHLAKARDLLLPKLMSGAIPV